MSAKEDFTSVVDAEGSKFALSSLACAAISTFVFAELYHMRRADTDLVVLGTLFCAAAFCLFSGYKALLLSHLRAAGRGARRSSPFFAIFQANFAYFSAFAFLASVALPAFNTSGARVAGLPWSWLHAALSVLPASLLAYSLASL